MFKKDSERTPEERARRAQLSIVARLGGCGYLVYLMVQLLQAPAEERTTLMVTMAVVLLIGSAVVIAFTLYDLVVALKTGRFNASTYEDLENNAEALAAAEAGEAAAEDGEESEEDGEDENEDDPEDGGDPEDDTD